MGFLEELRRLDCDSINKIEFGNRTVVITFKTGTHLKAVCPNENDQYDILKNEMKIKLSPEKFFDYDS